MFKTRLQNDPIVTESQVRKGESGTTGQQLRE
jgi:hypothetical protein